MFEILELLFMSAIAACVVMLGCSLAMLPIYPFLNKIDKETDEKRFKNARNWAFTFTIAVGAAVAYILYHVLGEDEPFRWGMILNGVGVAFGAFIAGSITATAVCSIAGAIMKKVSDWADERFEMKKPLAKEVDAPMYYILVACFSVIAFTACLMFWGW